MSDARTIVVTGVSRGLGREMARSFAAAGHTVWGCARSEKAVESLSAELGAPHSIAVVNVASDGDVASWAEGLLASGVVPDLIVNNAALINDNAPLWKVPVGEFDAVVDVNIKGVTNVIRHFLPSMIAKGRGVVVNFSSGWGRSTAPEVAPYCATKFAMEGLSAALAQELPAGMAAVALNPGIIDTEMLRSCFGSGAGSFPDAEQWARRAVPYILGIGAAQNGQPLTVPGG